MPNQSQEKAGVEEHVNRFYPKKPTGSDQAEFNARSRYESLEIQSIQLCAHEKEFLEYQTLNVDEKYSKSTDCIPQTLTNAYRINFQCFQIIEGDQLSVHAKLEYFARSHTHIALLHMNPVFETMTCFT